MRTLELEDVGLAQPAESRWRYGLLVDDVACGGFSCESYGVFAEDPATGQRESLRHITADHRDALALLAVLARGDVSPVHLRDVAEDWLAR